MQTLHHKIEDDLYQVTCGRKADNDRKILIYTVIKFDDSGMGTEVNYNELDPNVQHTLAREIARRFSE